MERYTIERHDGNNFIYDNKCHDFLNLNSMPSDTSYQVVNLLNSLNEEIVTLTTQLSRHRD